ncbi:CBS domain-containing protein [Streptacidiphilus monticola]|jgi:CBS domain-containing protein|uniref:CBS domain-containing protein n=1 Tax=Streptacidiphilus monticola TaxID=2161674 RepID=A0ABW1G897_9ACTN
MPEKVRDVMTTRLVTVSTTTALTEAARQMRDQGIGDLIVTDDSGRLFGLVTDRDLVVRATAEGRDPDHTETGQICSRNLTTVTPDDDVDRAVALMRDRAVRRLPVVEDGRPVGIVSLGDLALDRDRQSALADISAAPANS